MARDKLITIRIEGDKRKAFGELAKSQNTDTATLLYDFISQCLSGEIDISLVTGKGNRIDKIDNQIGSERIDKLETTTQRLDERVGQISKKLTDWVEAFSDRLNDCDRELSEKMVSLEHRLNALAMQLDSQGDSQQIGSIDTDSQQDRQGETPDIEPVATVETVYTVKAAIDKVETAIETVEAVTDTVEAVDKVETTNKVESVDEPDTSPIPNQETVEDAIELDKGAIDPVPGEGDSIDTVTGEGMNANKAHEYLISKGIEDISYYYLNKWAKDGVIPWRGKKVQKYLTLRDGLYYPNPD